jgi:hypothetical protein
LYKIFSFQHPAGALLILAGNGKRLGTVSLIAPSFFYLRLADKLLTE